MRPRRVAQALLGLLLVLGVTLVGSPAWAHHKDGHENGPGHKQEAEESEGQGQGRSRDRYEPDPEQEQTPPATRGPRECPEYSQEEGGPYDHDNCDGSQGLHGSGGNGKCAGCTGKADDKSPGGQYPGDHNNGYECDHNSGVGWGNPAHSRCANRPPPPTCPPRGCPPPPCPPGTARCPKPPVVCPPKAICDFAFPQPPRPQPPRPQPPDLTVHRVGILPVTGAPIDIGPSLAAALSLISSGTFLLTLRRKRR